MRTTMAGLVVRLRRMIADPASDSQVFSDDELLDALDVYQLVHRYERTQPVATIQPGGVRIYLDYYAYDGDWEADESLYDASFNVLTPATADRLVGHWKFPANTGLVVWITGKTYDLHAAAADVLESWAAKVHLDFDFSDLQAQFRRSQQMQMLLQMAAQHRAKSRPRTATLQRDDISVADPIRDGTEVGWADVGVEYGRQ